METKRLSYLDAARGLGILLVIFGHSFRPAMRAAVPWCETAYQFVYRFHVPLLFMLSGICYEHTAHKNHSLHCWQYLRKRSRQLLRPWFSYSVLIYVLFALVQLIPPCQKLLAQSGYQLLSPLAYGQAMLRNENPYSFHLWYLQTLFLFTSTRFFLDKWVSPKTVRRVLWGLLFLSPAFYQLFCLELSWGGKAFFQQMGYFSLGCILAKTRWKRYAPALVCLGAAGGLWLLAAPQFAAAKNGPLAALYLERLAAAGLCCGILAGCFLLQDRIGPLARFGRRSMVYYLYHQPFCCGFAGLVLYDKLHIRSGATVFLCMWVSLFLPDLFCFAVRQTGLGSGLTALGLPWEKEG